LKLLPRFLASRFLLLPATGYGAFLSKALLTLQARERVKADKGKLQTCSCPFIFSRLSFAFFPFRLFAFLLKHPLPGREQQPHQCAEHIDPG
jgi:hypothetical protein